MKAQEKTEKAYIKLKFATALDKLLKKAKVRSLKELSKQSGMESAHLARISRAELDVTLSTCIAISNALAIPYAQLATEYDNITEGDMKLYVDVLNARRKLRGKEKIPVKNKKTKRPLRK